mmetsp:Transcript_10368/g.22847  ORF Transcript_10368/g.22847 Transcript_10368/m.22847 type:complete len:260 (-) Transcript_10368:365-1144(-)
MGDTLESLTDEQIEAAFATALQNDAFMALCKELSDEANNQINADKNKALSSGDNLVQAMQDLKLSPQDMKISIKHANEMFNAFAAAVVGLVVNENAASADGILSGYKNTPESLNEEAKDKVLTVMSGPDNADAKIKELMKIKAFVDADTFLNSQNANSGINEADDDQTKNVYTAIINDPELMKMLLKANPDLANRLKCQKDPSKCAKLFDENGDEINLIDVITKSKLTKLMETIPDSDNKGIVGKLDPKVKMDETELTT